MGLTNPKTMNLRGKIKEEVILLINLGATNNFFSIKAVQKLHLPYSSMVEFEVTLGNGERIQGEGECKQFEIEVHRLKICDDFFASGAREFRFNYGLAMVRDIEKKNHYKQESANNEVYIGRSVCGIKRGSFIRGHSNFNTAMEQILKKEKQVPLKIPIHFC